MDTNKDGKISLPEFRIQMRLLNEKHLLEHDDHDTDVKEVDALFHDLDKDGNDQL